MPSFSPVYTRYIQSVKIYVLVHILQIGLLFLMMKMLVILKECGFSRP